LIQIVKTFGVLFTLKLFEMRSLLICIIVFLSLSLFAQSTEFKSFERKGLIIGAAFGVSSIHLSFPEQASFSQTNASFPNIKIGAMISPKLAILAYLPGTVYSYSGNGSRKRDRGFEGIVPSVQYWLKDRWWLLGGAGLGMDAPAFYDIKNESERKFYFGSTLLAGTGFELWRWKNCALDLQGRVQYGTAKMPEGIRKGVAFSVGVGLNLY